MSGQTRDVVSAFVRVLNNGDERFIADLLDPDFVDRTPTLKQDEGPQAFIAQKLRNLREAFPDLTLRITTPSSKETASPGVGRCEAPTSANSPGVLPPAGRWNSRA